MTDDDRSPIGQRIQVLGSSCSGKSTLAARLAKTLGVPFVELDALNWESDWVGLSETNPDELERRLRHATSGDRWVVAGTYSAFSEPVFWQRLQTVVFLDLPLAQLLWRVLIRSWRRWRSKELLWGTNYERFWHQFLVWKKDDSLVRWIVEQHNRVQEKLVSYMTDPRWTHIRFIRLT